MEQSEVKGETASSKTHWNIYALTAVPVLGYIIQAMWLKGDMT